MKDQSHEENHSTWRDLYQRALREQDRRKQTPLMSRAHTVIMGLMLRYAMTGRTEDTLANPGYQELVAALEHLRVIKQQRNLSKRSLRRISEAIAG
jgi:hypothetical protein